MSVLKGVFLGILLVLAYPVIAQRSLPKNMIMADFQRFHFGYSVGVSTSGFTAIPKDGYQIDLVQNPGININLITDYRIGKFMDIRFLPGIEFASRGLAVTNKITAETKNWSIESVYVDLPILLKYRSQRVNNYAPYLLAGINPRIAVLRHEIPLGGFGKATPMLKVFDIYPELGVGVDFYLAMAKVAVELKFCVGLLNVFLPPLDDKGEPVPAFNLYTAGVDRLTSRMVVLAFHVEQSK
jgi:hypothetical protein